MKPRTIRLVSAAIVGLLAAAITGVAAGVEPPKLLVALLSGTEGGPVQVHGAIRMEHQLLEPGSLRKAAKDLRARTGGATRIEGDRLVTTIVGADSERANALRRASWRAARFELREVLHGHPAIARFTEAANRGWASTPTVRAEIEHWEHFSTSREFTDQFVTAATRAELERFFEELQQQDPTARLPDNAELVYEQLQSEQPDSAPRWRSYLVARESSLSISDIANAAVQESTYTGQPEVMVDFTEHGETTFAELTHRVKGQKLAILFDGVVQSAPVVQDSITGGRMTITLGYGASNAEQRAEAAQIAEALRAPAGSADLKLVELQLIPPSVSPGKLSIAHGLFAGLVGLAVALLTLLALVLRGIPSPDKRL